MPFEEKSVYRENDVSANVTLAETSPKMDRAKHTSSYEMTVLDDF